MTQPVLEVQGLKTQFFTDQGVVRAVDDVSFSIPRGKTLGLVGESGCGKSVTALSIMRLIAPPGRIVQGRVLLHAQEDQPPVDLLQLSPRAMRRVRGHQIAMIFQEPMTSLNPVFTIGSQIVEAILEHWEAHQQDGRRPSRRQARQIAIRLLEDVKIPEPQRRFYEYPHQFSGGMRQRAMIAMALSCRPKLLIADEPTTALDVTIQAQILDLLRQLQQAYGMSILMITHDLGIIAELAHEVAVMYAGRIVERASVEELFSRPLHPYTQGLLRSRPRPGARRDQPLATIAGEVPSPRQLPPGCRFHPRCPFVQQRCREEEPELRQLTPGHWASCHFAEQIQEQGAPEASTSQ